MGGNFMFVEDEYCCSNCEEHEETNSHWQIYCKVYKTYYDRKETCSHQRRIRKSEGTGLGCYITTIVCNILGYEDDCEVLNSMRDLRNNYMQQDPKYKDMLFEYDTIGPEIAKCLANDPIQKLVASVEYDYALKPISKLVKEKKYEEAVENYKKMTDVLKGYYDITDEVKAPSDYDYSQGGHGLVKKIGTNPNQ
jgi:hypothetical protein